MSENTVFVKTYRADEFPYANDGEIWRYAGYPKIEGEIDEELKNILSCVKSDLKNSLSYKTCYKRMSLEWKNDEPCLPFSVKSNALSRLLDGCNEIILFSATIGLEIDRYIAKQQKTSPVKALLANAYGTERIESLCDAFCRDITEQIASDSLFATRRFSPGYADLPLDIQIDFFKLLDCNRRIGVSLNKSLLMSPSKSVTAIMGLKSEKCTKNGVHKCGECENISCVFRKQE